LDPRPFRIKSILGSNEGGGMTPVTVETKELRELQTAAPVVLTTAELSECTCPEFCERDHDVD
jgi:hypothetical protein